MPCTCGELYTLHRHSIHLKLTDLNSTFLNLLHLSNCIHLNLLRLSNCMNFTCMHPTRLRTSNPREAMKEKTKTSNARPSAMSIIGSRSEVQAHSPERLSGSKNSACTHVLCTSTTAKTKTSNARPSAMSIIGSRSEVQAHSPERLSGSKNSGQDPQHRPQVVCEDFEAPQFRGHVICETLEAPEFRAHVIC